MSSFRTYLESTGKSKTTIGSYTGQLSIYLDWSEKQGLDPFTVTYGDVMSFFKHLEKKEIKQITKRSYLNILNNYYEWLKAEEKRTDNPTTNIQIKGVKRRSLYDLLSKNYLDELYSDYPQRKQLLEDYPEAKQRDKIMLGLMIYQGMNGGEIARLEVKDVKLREGKITIRGGRKSNERTLDLAPVQIMDLMEYQFKTRNYFLEANKIKESDYFLTFKGGDSSNQVHRLLKEIGHSIGQLRTSVITHWLKINNLREVQYKAGHKYVSSTEAYLVNDLEDLSQDIAKYHPF